MDNRYSENQKSWIARNWPWALPVGCCSGCLVLVLLFVFGVGATIFWSCKQLSRIVAC